MREHTEERLEQEWKQLYERMKRVLEQYGKDDINGGDYFLVDENFERYTHQVEIHELHMLRPEIIKALQSLLVDYPDWEIEISVYMPDRKISIDPGALTIRDTEVIDALDREMLPTEYQAIKYEGSRPLSDFFVPQRPVGMASSPDEPVRRRRAGDIRDQRPQHTIVAPSVPHIATLMRAT